jgi:ABC-type amino acid transport substrate-binding protein
VGIWPVVRRCKESLAYAVSLDDPELAARVNTAQQAVRKRGELARISRRWLK